MIHLSRGDWALSVNPELGAALTRLTWQGKDILRPAADGADDPLQTGCFPLLPYANRIARGAFAHGGRDIRVPATPGFEPHALHGQGWKQPWRVVLADEGAVTLGLGVEASGNWPWSWAATHRVSLTPDGVVLELAMVNEDRTSMPAGLGLHPYFRTDGSSVLTVPAGEVWLTDESGIPTALVPARQVVDWSSGVFRADAVSVDHAYAGWSGVATLEHDDCRVTLTASPNASRVQIYAPPDAPFVCIEPVTHRPDAHNAPPGEATGLVSLAPGETLSMSMQITAGPGRRTMGYGR